MKQISCQLPGDNASIDTALIDLVTKGKFAL